MQNSFTCCGTFSYINRIFIHIICIEYDFSQNHYFQNGRHDNKKILLRLRWNFLCLLDKCIVIAWTTVFLKNFCLNIFFNTKTHKMGWKVSFGVKSSENLLITNIFHVSVIQTILTSLILIKKISSAVSGFSND